MYEHKTAQLGGLMQNPANAANCLASQPMPAPPVDSAISRLNGVIASARDEFDQITSRICPILTVTTNSTAQSDSKQTPSSCELESRINDMRYSVESLIEQMRSIRQSLCI